MAQETVNGCEVIQKANSGRSDYPWVVLCKDPNLFVVWYVDADGNTLVGDYHTEHDAALAEFESRSR